MLRFILRHFTALLVITALAAWALFYVPRSPSWAVLRAKQAIDARDGPAAAEYVDFESVVKHAAYEMIEKKGSSNPFGSIVGRAAVDFLIKPMAQVAQAWAIREVNTGAKEVQMPAVAVAGSIVLLHRSGDTAYTNFTDHKGQVWEIHLARQSDGYWRVIEVKDINQLLEKLQREQQKQLGRP
ncbi:MAG: DUF2939 domain-containing protein [Candidatus Binatus sp.]|uniref:DUF2939 domain-containing protein n=1 Tax=Candidatus Binatus sp. TaxID=2811406 RepID=UPI002725DD35|nr:DUF2939 domain-containing protein [Candidatus Binatus sp.]MDO8433890.1 DUF2939 domain-containing protein [Candidatus Binatus sp.]